MARIVVAYTSKYGGTKQYAQWIAAALGADMLELTKRSAPGLASYDAVIFGGGLYAGRIAGIGLIRSMFPKLRSKTLALFTVGLVSPQSAEYFQKLCKRQFTPDMHAKIRAFHFQGGIDYARLTPAHRIMMRMLGAVLRRKKPASLSADERALLLSIGKSHSYAEEANIEPLLGHIMDTCYK